MTHKAREHRVKRTDLATTDQLLTGLYTEVMENEFIPHEDREKILVRLDGLTRGAEEPEERREDLRREGAAVAASAERGREQVALLASLGVGAVVVSAGITFFAGDLSNQSEAALGVAGAAVSAAFVTGTAFWLRVRERATETDRAEDAETFAARFESVVDGAFRSAGAKPLHSTPDKGLDFVYELRGKKVAVEVASSLDRMSQRSVHRRLERVRDAGARLGADDTLLVVPNSDQASLRALRNESVRIVDPSGLEDYLLRGDGQNGQA